MSGQQGRHVSGQRPAANAGSDRRNGLGKTHTVKEEAQ
jgi:hypothetical protein